MVSFISIAYVVVKLKIFIFSCLASASMKWPFLVFMALVPLNIVRPYWNFDQRKSNKTHFLKNPWKFGSNGTTLLVPFCWVWGNNSSKQRQIELKFLPRGDLIALQMPLKEFWKSQIFTETERTQKFEFLVQLRPQVNPWRRPKPKIAIDLSRSVKIKALSLSIFNENWYFFMHYSGFFRV